MGGSSSVNAMVYTRGNPNDYNNWAALGNEGWSYQDVLPYFKKSENNECFGANDYRGVGGAIEREFFKKSQPDQSGVYQGMQRTGHSKQPRLQRCKAIRRLAWTGHAKKRGTLEFRQGVC